MTGNKRPNGRAALRVKLSDVAKVANVHPSTVSRVLNSSSSVRVSPEVVDRITRTARELGYRPNALAAGLRTQSTGTAGFIVHDINDPIYPPILKGLEAALSEYGTMVLLGHADDSQETGADILDRMSAHLVDGVILGTARLQDSLVDKCLADKLPAVAVLRRPAEAIIPSVVNDCKTGMCELMGVVTAYGHRDIAHIAGPQHYSTGRERLEGFQAGLEAAGLDIAPSRVAFVDHPVIEAGQTAAEAILDAEGSRPSVIVCVNDLVAIGALMACQDRGISCPDDISITGYNDIPFARFLSPSLTTVRMQLHEIGFRSGERLAEQFADPGKIATVEHIPPEVVVRRSLARV